MERRAGMRVTLAFLALHGFTISCTRPEAPPLNLNPPTIQDTSTFPPDVPKITMNQRQIVSESLLKIMFDLTDLETKEFELANESKKYLPGLQPQNVYELYYEDFKATSLRKFQRMPFVSSDPNLADSQLLSLCEETSTDFIPEATGLLNWPIFKQVNQWPSLRHPAIDLNGFSGESVSAADGGIVIGRIESNAGYGNQLIINHGRGRLTNYAHLSQMRVNVGDKVEKNSPIGMIGSTGQSTGPHLHFEIIKRDKDNCSFVNPLLLLP